MKCYAFKIDYIMIYMFFKVWDQYNLEVADYVRVSVSHGIQPSHDDIHQGDLICLRSTVNLQKGKIIAE